jgi:DNA polymerase III subunit beta
MKIKTPHPQLIRALEIVSKISTKHITLPVLQCVLITAKDGVVTLRTTNLEIGLEVTLEAGVDEDGVVAVPAQTLLQSVHFLDEKEVVLYLEEGVLRLQGAHTQTSIKAVAHDEFPSLHRVEGEGVVMQAELFAFGIKSVAFATSVSSIKPELGSVLVQQKREHSLTFVATDSFRLVEKTVSQKGMILAQSFLLPQRNALEIARVCEIVGGAPALTVTENQCALVFSTGVYITSRLVTGSFPDYEQIIPKEYSTTVTVLRDDLQRSLRKTNIFLNKFLQVGVAVTDAHLTVSATNSDVGHTTDTLKAQVEGGELTLNFNQQYLVEPLGQFTDESLILRFAGVGRPLVIVGTGDTSLRYLVMPMNK